MNSAPSLREASWNGQPAYLVGGGPSLKDFDWDLLNPLRAVIVVNGAMKHAPNAAMFFTEDIRFIERFSETTWYKAFKGAKVFHALDIQYQEQALKLDPDIHIIQKHGGNWERNDKYWSKSFKDGLSWSSNSMIGALNIADILGANPIYLLGVDCNPLSQANPNFHELYPKDWHTADGQLESFKSDFKYWAAPNLRHRNVINLNASSAVDCWPKLDRDQHFVHLGCCYMGD